MSPTRSGYKLLGLDLVSLEKKTSHTPKIPSMEGENKDEGTWYPFKLFLDESLVQHKNDMMDSFSQILWRLPIRNGYSSSEGDGPFKVDIKLDIPRFDGQIDAYVVDKWLNLLAGYFFVHKISNRETITFLLLKVIPDVKYWWEDFCEKMETKEPSLFTFTLI